MKSFFKNKKYRWFFLVAISLFLIYSSQILAQCLTGAFIADRPTKDEIANFKDSYGKKPYLVMVFVDWNNYIDEKVIQDIYTSGCTLFVSWEPWHAELKKGINYDDLLLGKYDAYIKNFASKLKAINKPFFIRFGHEMNGNWYPWSGIKIGKDKYIAVYKYIKNKFSKLGIENAKWVFSINWEDIPKENNHFLLYYPGDDYVDYIGIDGYNWGDTKPWSRWLSFKELFEKRYKQITDNLNKPVIISEFSSTSKGGNKVEWIKEAMGDIKRMGNIKAFVLFNIDKETDWSFPANTDSGKELKVQLENSYFKDTNYD